MTAATETYREITVTGTPDTQDAMLGELRQAIRKADQTVGGKCGASVTVLSATARRTGSLLHRRMVSTRRLMLTGTEGQVAALAGIIARTHLG